MCSEAALRMTPSVRVPRSATRSRPARGRDQLAGFLLARFISCGWDALRTQPLGRAADCESAAQFAPPALLMHTHPTSRQLESEVAHPARCEVTRGSAQYLVWLHDLD